MHERTRTCARTLEHAMKVSIVIVCMNRPDNLYPCLDCISTNTRVECKTFVVAYKYDKDSLKEAVARYPWVEFIVSDEWRGFAENNNLALRKVDTPYTLIINDDTEFDGPMIDTMVADFEALGDHAGIIASPLYNQDGTIQFCGRKSFSAGYYIRHAWHLADNPSSFDGFESIAVDGRTLYRVGNVSGACFMIRSDLFRRLGFFDERFFFTPEDIALSEAVAKAGYGVYMDSSLHLVHKYHGSTSRMTACIRPAEIRGCLIHLSRGSVIRYAIIAIPVWAAEMSKRIKASVRCIIGGTDRDRTSLQVYRNTTRSIFSNKTTKEIFLKYLPKQ